MTPVMVAKGSLIPLPLLEMIPSGYYAVRPDDETPYRFLRLARPTYGKKKGWVKVQTQHSDDLVDRWFWNPANPDPRTCVYKFDRTIEDSMLLMIADHRKAGRAYAAEISACHFCNKALTDERSRWYGFGPECEKSAEGEKDEIDDENGGTYEYLRDTKAQVYLDFVADEGVKEQRRKSRNRSRW